MLSLSAFLLLAAALAGLAVALRSRRPWLVAAAATLPAAVFGVLALLSAAYDLLAGVVLFAVLAGVVAGWGAALAAAARRAARRETVRAAAAHKPMQFTTDDGFNAIVMPVRSNGDAR